VTKEEIAAYNKALRLAADIVRRYTAIPEDAHQRGTGVRDRTVVDGERMMEDILKKRMPEVVTIGGDGFFAGCKITIDPSLPPDTIELRGANIVRGNTRTGEITVEDTP
jgi:hypothetical protein